MKVKLITQHRVFNYGSVLQTYATQKAIEKTGNDAEVIDYFSPQRTDFKKFCELPDGLKITSAKGIFHILSRLPANLRKKRVFGGFLKKHINLTKKYISYKDLQKDPPAADVYMTGSDQVWNSEYNEGVDRGYFLDFGEKSVRRVSYAASIGEDFIPERYALEVKKYLERYDAITVRETAAKEALHKIGIDNTTVVLDPTLLLDSTEWNKIAIKPKQSGYILVAILYGEECGIPETATQISQKTGLPVIELTWNPLKKRQWKTVYGCSPEEFLGYVANAAFVITNSFHVTSFCINYQKDFVAVKREKFNTRIKSLLDLLEINERYIGQGEMNDRLLKPVLYDDVTKRVSALRQKSYGTLKQIIGG